MSEECDLAESTKLVGQLYPVLVDAKGEVIDGKHRQDADPNWRVEQHPEIDSPKKYWAARLIANKARREIPQTEVSDYMNKLAEILFEEGVEPGRISGEVARITGYSAITVRQYLDDKYKDEKKAFWKGKEVMSDITPQSSGTAEPELPQTVERFLGAYADALHKIPEDTRDRDTIFLETIRSFFLEKNVTCPRCGAKGIQWSCGHEL